MNETIDNETLLKTLSENPDAAHFLADLAAGGDLHQLIEAHFGITLSAPASEHSEHYCRTRHNDMISNTIQTLCYLFF
jgi:hypothetical protein